jgi:hypothetical protein
VNPDELTPLSRQDADPLVRALLRAGQRERAPEKSEERLLTLLGVGGVAGGTGVVAAIARTAARLGAKGFLSSPVIATAAVIAAATIGASVWSFGSSPARETPPAAEAAIAQPVAAPPVARVAPRATAPAPADVPSMRVEDLPSSAPPGSAKLGAAVAQRSPEEPGPSLAHEVELVEAARAALARGDAAGALRSLDAHDRELPAGALMPESRVLRIEALVRAGGDGNRERANTLGDAFLSANPTGPQARRVRSVLDRAP